MTPQAKWAAETGLDPDDYSVWDGNQSAQRVKAHRWALARADEYCPEGIHIVTNRNCGSVQLVKGHEVATLDVDDRGDLGEDPYIGLTDMWNGTPQRDEWGRVGCYAWAIERLMEAA